MIDIINKRNCEKFIEQRNKWLKWFDCKDPNSINNQVNSLIWNYNLYSTLYVFTNSYKIGPKSNNNYNEPVMSLYDSGYVALQSLAIRKLIDKSKDVYSLGGVITGIKNNIQLFTRENYVSYDGLPYDYLSKKEEFHKKLFSNPSRYRVGSAPSSGPDAWPMSERAHKNFDILSKVEYDKSKRTDKIKIEIVGFLEKKIEELETIKNIVDKYFAHAATPKSRKNIETEERDFTLTKINKSIEIIYKVASYIRGIILFDSAFGGVPIPQFDHMEYIDKPWVKKSDIKYAKDRWNVIKTKISDWCVSRNWTTEG